MTDGPFAETKEFVAGFDVLDCADLDEAIAVEAKNPVAQFHPFELRPFLDGLRLGPGAPAFGKGDDSAGSPYLLTGWVGETPADWPDDQALTRECDAWRQELEASGILVLGNALGGPETARTMRRDHGEMRLTDGPFLDTARVHRKRRCHQLRRSAAGGRARCRPSAGSPSRDRGSALLQRMTVRAAAPPRL